MSSQKRAQCLVVLITAGFAVGCSRPAQPPAAQNAQPAPAPAAAPAQPPTATPAQTPGGPASPPGTPAAPAAASAAAPAAAPTSSSARAGAGAAPAPAPLAPKPREATLAAGTIIEVRTTAALSTKTHKTGEPVAAVLAEPLVDGDWVIAPKGATVSGVIINADEGGRVKGRASLSVAMTRLTLSDGQTLAITTSSHGVQAKSAARKDATKVGVGAGAGVLIGAIAGGKKGAAIGGAVGAGAGTATVLATRGEPAVIPAATTLRFKLTEPVTVTKKQ